MFALNIALFASSLDLVDAGFDDASNGIEQYNDLLRPMRSQVGVADAGVICFFQVAFVLVELLVLAVTRLLTPQGLALYLVWPFSALLAVKIKQEFLFFPLAFIRKGRNALEELLITGGILGVALALGENNGLLIVGYRVLRWMAEYLPQRRRLLVWMASMVAALVACSNFELLSSVVPWVARFCYTRDIVNPEYSPIESVLVFIASFHLGITPQLDWWFGGPFTLAALGLAVWGWPRGDAPARREARLDQGVTALAYVAATELSHAFQSSRYYYFGVPASFPRLTINLTAALAALSVLHALVAAGVYQTLR